MDCMTLERVIVMVSACVQVRAAKPFTKLFAQLSKIANTQQPGLPAVPAVVVFSSWKEWSRLPRVGRRAPRLAIVILFPLSPRRKLAIWSAGDGDWRGRSVSLDGFFNLVSGIRTGFTSLTMHIFLTAFYMVVHPCAYDYAEAQGYLRRPLFFTIFTLSIHINVSLCMPLNSGQPGYQKGVFIPLHYVQQ